MSHASSALLWQSHNCWMRSPHRHLLFLQLPLLTFNLRAVKGIAEKRQICPWALAGPEARNIFILFPLVTAFLPLNSRSEGSCPQTGCLLRGFVLYDSASVSASSSASFFSFLSVLLPPFPEVSSSHEGCLAEIQRGS